MKRIGRVNKKDAENFAGQKRTKTAKRTRNRPKRAKPGAFWVLEGMGTVENGSNQMRKPSVRTRMNPIPMQHRQKENRRKPSVFAGFVAGAEGLEPSARGFGVDVGKHTRERGRVGVDQFLLQVRKGAVLVWCCGEKSGPKHLKFCGGENKEKAFHSSFFKASSSSGKSP